MSPTTEETQQRERKRPRHDGGTAKQKQGVPWKHPETGQYSLLVRSTGVARQSKLAVMSLSEPAQGEECCITLEPIAEARLSFLPASFKDGLVEDQPRLSKASLPCGHGFNALALLYHFAKNSMTCPFCRDGHDKVRLNSVSIPRHLRWHFVLHLAAMRTEENREQVEADAAAASSLMQQEVSRGGGSFIPMTRIVLLLFAYDSMDGSGDQPTLALELPLTSSLRQGTLEFASFGYSLAQLNLNLMRLPNRPSGFELAVGLQSLFHGNSFLFRTVRFPATGATQRVVFSRDIREGEPVAICVSTMHGVDGLNVFYRMSWTTSLATFSSLVVDSALRQAQEGETVAAV